MCLIKKKGDDTTLNMLLKFFFCLMSINCYSYILFFKIVLVKLLKEIEIIVHFKKFIK